MKKNFIILIFSIVTMAFSCEKTAMEEFYPILFVNNFEESVEFYFVKPGGGKLYPDTTLANVKPIFITVPPKQDRSAYLKVKYELFFNEIPSDTLSVFVLHSDTLNKYTWGEVRDGYMILKRYDLSLEDLKSMNWTITYP